MPLSLLLPAGLAALGALLLPLLIHLARRSEHRPTDFAALRWLRAQPRPRHQVRFNEWLLLALRLLLLALLAVLLAQPVLTGGGTVPAQVMVAPGVPLQRARELNLPADAQWRWLAPGFPSIDAPAPSAPTAQASLLRERDATLPQGTALTVVVPERWGALDAQRPQLSRAVRWEVIAGTASPLPKATPPLPLQLLAYTDAPASRSDALLYLRALQGAWQPQHTTLEVRRRDAAAPPAAAVAVWLDPAPLPARLQQWVHDGGRMLLAAHTSLPQAASLQPRWHDDQGGSLLDGAAFGRGQLLRFTRALDPVAMPQLLDADLPDLLRGVLEPAATPQQAFAADHTPTTGARALAVPAQPLAPWLALAIALLFLFERWLATSPRRGHQG